MRKRPITQMIREDIERQGRLKERIQEDKGVGVSFRDPALVSDPISLINYNVRYFSEEQIPKAGNSTALSATQLTDTTGETGRTGTGSGDTWTDGEEVGPGWTPNEWIGSWLKDANDQYFEITGNVDDALTVYRPNNETLADGMKKLCTEEHEKFMQRVLYGIDSDGNTYRPHKNNFYGTGVFSED